MRNSALNSNLIAVASAALVLWVALLFYCSSASASPPADLWYGIYLMGTGVGASHMTTAQGEFEGTPAAISSSETDTSFNLLGTTVSQDVSSRDYSSIKDDKPLYEEVVMNSGGHSTTITARFTDRTVTATLDSGDHKETKVLTVPAGAELLADDPTMTPPTIHGKRQVYFDPATIALEDVSVVPAPGEAKGSSRVVVTTATEGASIAVTVDQGSDGAPNKIEMPGGLSMQRQTSGEVSKFLTQELAAALGLSRAGAKGVEQAPPDLAVITSVGPVGQPLLPNPTVLSAVVTQPGQPPITFDIHAVKAPVGDQDTLQSILGRADLAPYLADSPYLGLSNDAVRNQSKQILSNTTNLYDIAVQLKRWVSSSMTPSASIGLPRSATDILNDKRGVCRDYALLYTALARSVGLPTRLCAGLVGYNGRFYYHAWAESFVGGTTGWMPFDPTLPREPVDASHIPLAKGDPGNLYDLVGKIGDLKVEIVRCTQ